MQPWAAEGPSHVSPARENIPDFSTKNARDGSRPVMQSGHRYFSVSSQYPPQLPAWKFGGTRGPVGSGPHECLCPGGTAILPPISECISPE